MSSLPPSSFGSGMTRARIHAHHGRKQATRGGRARTLIEDELEQCETWDLWGADDYLSSTEMYMDYGETGEIFDLPEDEQEVFLLMVGWGHVPPPKLAICPGLIANFATRWYSARSFVARALGRRFRFRRRRRALVCAVGAVSKRWKTLVERRKATETTAWLGGLSW